MSSFADLNYQPLASSMSDRHSARQKSNNPVTQFEDNRTLTNSLHGLHSTYNKSLRSDHLTQLHAMAHQYVSGRITGPTKRENNTGMPDNLKSGIEHLSGFSMDDVKVHYNSNQPAQLNALAFAQGTDIHLAPGQEKHLPHEAWHVVQQKQGRVKPTRQLKSKWEINDDPGLEREADRMGLLATSNQGLKKSKNSSNSIALSLSPIFQRKVGFEFENRQLEIRHGDIAAYRHDLQRLRNERINQKRLNELYEFPPPKSPILSSKYFTLETDNTLGRANVEFVIHGKRPGKSGFRYSQEGQLRDTLQEVASLATRLEELSQDRGPHSFKELDGRSRASFLFYKNHDEQYIMQATAGIRMDKLIDLFHDEAEGRSYLSAEGDRYKGEWDHTDLMKQRDIPEEAIRNRLLNLIYLIKIYVQGASGYRLGYMKNITPLMARTDFAQLFELLPGVTKSYFREYPDHWTDLLLVILGKNRDSNLRDNRAENERIEKLRQIKIVDWAEGMLSGRDLLAEEDTSHAMGALGQKTDRGRPDRRDAPRKQPIFEFRKMPSKSPGEFVEEGMKFFRYAKRLNKER